MNIILAIIPTLIPILTPSRRKFLRLVFPPKTPFLISLLKSTVPPIGSRLLDFNYQILGRSSLKSGYRGVSIRGLSIVGVWNVWNGNLRVGDMV